MQGLYIHIPFCEELCTYCDFPKRVKMSYDYKKVYLNKLLRDLIHVLKENAFDTVYIGGGTPNFLPDEMLEAILKKIDELKQKPISEFTIEGNYNHISPSQCAILKKYGVNRVSLGVQTLNKRLGNVINRYTDKQLLRKNVALLRSYGINNINLDFMFGLPYQKINDVKADLAIIKELKVPHVSYYALILEEKSVIYHQLNEGKITLPDADLVADMYDLVIEELKQMGYHHYEISNFSFPGYESKHNLLYWSLDNYYGIGMSASSLINHTRRTESKLIKDYLENRGIIKEELTSKELANEFFWLGLRKIDGVSIKEFKKRFAFDPFLVYDINGLIDKGLLVYDGDYLKLTKLGLDHGNYVFCAFLT